MDVDHQIIHTFSEGNFEQVFLLIEHNPFTSKVLDYVVDLRHFEILWELYRFGMVKGFNFFPFLENIIHHGRIEVVEHFFAVKRLDPNLCSSNFDITVLMQACLYCQRDIVELLLNCGADPEQKDRYGRNAFFYAAECTDISIFLLLFRRTQRLDYVDINRRTLLHDVCEPNGRSQELFDEILSLDVLDVNSQDQWGDTPLHVAITWFDPEDPLCGYRISRLIEHPNIDLEIENNHGESPMNLFRRDSFTPLIRETLMFKRNL